LPRNVVFFAFFFLFFGSEFFFRAVRRESAQPPPAASAAAAAALSGICETKFGLVCSSNAKASSFNKRVRSFFVVGCVLQQLDPIPHRLFGPFCTQFASPVE